MSYVTTVGGEQMVVIQCWAKEGCAISFAIPEALYDTVQAHGAGGFYCPRGHHLGLGESSVAKLEKRLSREVARHDQTRADRDYTERRRAAAQGQVTKIKNRIKHGVCPCCKRTFQNVARHMQSKHPEFVETSA